MNNVDPLGVAAERGRINSKLSAIGTQIAAGGLDQNARADLVLKQADINDRLNLSSTTKVGIERIST